MRSVRRGPSGSSLKVDVHSHFVPVLSADQSETLGIADAPWLRDDGDGRGFIMAGGEEYRPVESPLWDPVARLAQMDATGVDIQVMSATPILFAYAAESGRTATWAAMINDIIDALQDEADAQGGCL